MKEGETVINIDSCIDNMNQEAESADDKVENPHSTTVDVGGGGISPGSIEKVRKERRMSMSAKKPPKPPRPPRGLSLDAADQKLIKEISELLMLKRARIERMKALKKAKAAKGMYNSSSSSSGNLLAMVFTVLFCVVIIFQGCHPWGDFFKNGPISSKSDRSTEGDIYVKTALIKDKWNLSSNVIVGGSDNKGGGGEAI